MPVVGILSIVEGINTLLGTTAFAAVNGEARDDGSRFVQAIEALTSEPPRGVVAPGRADQVPQGAPDGVLDTFTQVRTGTALNFRARLRNRTVLETAFPQVFFLRIALIGDGAILREALVRVIVPEGPKLDGGLDDASALDVGAAPDAAQDQPDSGTRDAELDADMDAGS